MASPQQKRRVKRVMHEFKTGTLKGGAGRHGKVKSRRQAIAIAMSESGQSKNKRGRRKSPVPARKTAAPVAASARADASLAPCIGGADGSARREQP